MSNYPTEDLYRILGLNQSASRAEIDKAYREMVKRYHPDHSENWDFVRSKHPQKKGEDDVKYEERISRQIHHNISVINEAKKILRDPNQRAAYDRWYNQNIKGKKKSSSNANNAGGQSGTSSSSSSQSSQQQQANEKTYQDGRHYKGDMNADGEPHGQGKMTFAGGEIYEGQWQNGNPHGYGTMSFPNGEIYEGAWQDGHQHGKGQMLFQDGTYDGDWVMGNLHGTGTYTFKNGESYSGDFNNNEITGQGKYTYEDGSVYEGEMRNRKRHGKGKMEWSFNSKMDRAGRYGQKYEGDWINNQAHGKGKLRTSDEHYEGDFVYDKMQGHGKAIMRTPGKSLRSFEGQFHSNTIHGHGKGVFADGTFEGELRYGFPGYAGEGIFKFNDGREYEGSISSDVPHGKGTMTHPDGRVQKGKWKEGRYQHPMVKALKHTFAAATLTAVASLTYYFMQDHENRPYKPFDDIEGHTVDEILHGFIEHDKELFPDIMGPAKITNKQTAFLGHDISDDDFLVSDGTPTLKQAARFNGFAFEGYKYYGALNNNGQRHGYGIEVYNKEFSDHDHRIDDRIFIYAGEWKEDVREGQGQFFNIRNGVFGGTSFAGEVYQGEWKNGLRHGFGKAIYANGDTYEGEWKGGLYDGKGTYKGPERDNDTTPYGDDFVLSGGDDSAPSDFKYVGHFEAGEFDGYGVHTDPTGTYEGLFREGKRFGLGKFTREDGTVFEGTWNGDKYIWDGSAKAPPSLENN